MKGRKHLRLVDKKAKGTLRKCRVNNQAPAPQSEPPRAPAELSKRATEIFGTLVGRLQAIGMASATDTEVLALLAMRLEEIELRTADIKENGAVYAKAELIQVPVEEPDQAHPEKTVVRNRTRVQKIWKSNPVVTQRSEAMRHAQSLLAEFGLTPAARAKVLVLFGSAAPGNDGEWEELANS